MNLKFQKFATSRELDSATRYLLAAMLRYPAQLPDNLRLISPERAALCGDDGKAVQEILSQYEKNGAYSIATVKHSTKRTDLTKIAGMELESDLGFYVDVWIGEYCKWAFSEALKISESELVSTGVHTQAEAAMEQVKAYLHYDLKAQGETDWRKEIATEVENKLAGVKSSSITKNEVPGLNVIAPEFEAANLIVIAARPGMGKTQLLLRILQGFENQGAKGVVYTLEMPGRQMARRVLGAMASVNHRADWEVLSDEKKQRIRHCLDIIVNSGYDFLESTSLRQMLSECRQLHKQGKLNYLFVDHIGLASTGDTYKDRNNNDRVGAITGALKRLANELRIPVIILSQLSRAVETRGGSRRPMLSDLRDSGSVEQDADMVMFIYRPEYYGILEDEQGQSTVGIAELIVAKYRDGEIGTAVCGFHPVRGFVYTEAEMRGGVQDKIIAMRGQRDAQMPTEEPAWAQGNRQSASPAQAPTQRPNDQDTPF